MTAPDAAELASGRRTALVTGASAGIGAAIARALGELGWTVALGARRRERLEQVAKDVEAAGGCAFNHELDVSEPASVERFFAALEGAIGPADVVVNNAGINVPGLFHEADPADLEREVRTNLLGPMFVCRRALPGMIARGRGGDLVFISSHATRDHRPAQAAYGASKAGLEHLARTLGLELEGTGIRSTIIQVGATRSEFAVDWQPDKIIDLLKYWKRFGVQRHLAMMPAESVARAVVLAVTTPRGTHLGTIEVQPEAPSQGASDA
jgi:NAD(P)-dependent dehydrogenase (short-subunit alcohol dehydrogenase family)